MNVGNSFSRSYGSTDFITGFRAIAATLVVIIHTGGFAKFGNIGLNITSAEKYGVTFHSTTLNFIIVYCLTIILSMITYLFIEKPTNKVGKKLS